MRPGDHPDFFKFPPPAGTSRESTIVLDGQGRFWHEGARVTHQAMADAFASWISKHPDNGRFILTNGYDWSYFKVEDVPFFVKSVRVDGGAPGSASEAVTLELSDGTEETLNPRSLWVGDQDALYLTVKGGEFEARFTPAAQVALAPLVAETAEGAPALVIGGKTYPVASGRPD
jgi:uncharacterized protein